MAYSYTVERPKIFTEDGLRLLIGLRDQTKRMLKQSGAVRMQEAMSLPDGIGAADSWTCLACFDYMVERGELREVTAPGSCAGQHRVFVAG